MTSARVIEALALPRDSRVDQRVPKKLMLEQGAPTSGDKRLIQDGIEELTWVAALKPTNIGVPAFRDEVREYLEIAILEGTFRTDAKAARLIELVHRAIPYPLMLISTHDGALIMSLAHKRFSQAELGVVVVDGAIGTAGLTTQASFAEAFFGSIALASQPPTNLFTAYQGWVDRIEALAAAQITGQFTLAKSSEAVVARRAALTGYARAQDELAALRAQAAKEKQIKRRVELNLEIRRIEDDLGKLAKAL